MAVLEPPPTYTDPVRVDERTGRARFSEIWLKWFIDLAALINPAGLGTVTSVSGSGGTTGLTLTGGPITTSGTLTLGGTLVVANGGTGNTTGTATVNANLTGPITSSGNATAVAAQTGTGSTFVMDTSPTLVTPVLGVAAATSINFGGSALSVYVQSGSWTPSPTNLTIIGTPTYTGKYTRIGNLVYLFLKVESTTTTASTLGTTTFTGLPFTAGFPAAIPAIDETGSFTSLGTGLISGATLYTPTWAANSNTVISGCYLV